MTRRTLLALLGLAPALADQPLRTPTVPPPATSTVLILHAPEGPLYPNSTVAVRLQDLYAISIATGPGQKTQPPYLHILRDARELSLPMPDHDWLALVNTWAGLLNATIVDLRPGAAPTIVLQEPQVWLLPLDSLGLRTLALRPDRIASLQQARLDPAHFTHVRCSDFYSLNWQVRLPLDTLLEAWADHDTIDWRPS